MQCMPDEITNMGKYTDLDMDICHALMIKYVKLTTLVMPSCMNILQWWVLPLA